MPVYNVESCVAEAMRSVLGGSYADLELVVVDDHSTDGTLDAVRSVSDGRVRILRNVENMGAGLSRRRGIAASAGDYVMTVDGDDWVAPDFIGELMHTAALTGADIVSGGMTLPTNDCGGYKAVCYGSKEVSGAAQVTEVFGGDVVFLNNKVVNRRLYGLVPYSGLRYAEDTTTIGQLLYYSNKSVYVANCGYYYRQGAGSLTHRITKELEALYKAVCAKRLVEFYADKDPAYATRFNVGLFVKWANTFIAGGFDDALIEGHRELFDEFAVYYMRVVRQSMRGK